jgi:hypothetical protein
MREITTWTPGQRVEAYHPTYHREWGMATIMYEAKGTHDAYVTVRFDDGLRKPANGEHMNDNPIQTYHLNVREPGAPDPVSIL